MTAALETDEVGPVRHIRSERGGVLLDGVLALGLFLLFAYALDRVGITLPQLLAGAHRFIGG
ncbi:MAG: hypothetical protein L3K10_08070 [Thermoplasmata archaeon]|nr:hypothetical protein [Thermoplasmata archaeon]